jgi:hypothetical protein
MRAVCVFALVAALVFAQGERRGGRRSPQRQQQQHKEQPSELLATFHGVVRGLNAKSLTIADAEDNEVQFVCTKRTRYFDGDKAVKPEAIKPGARVSIEARTMLDASLEAVNVRLEQAKRRAEQVPGAP